MNLLITGDMDGKMKLWSLDGHVFKSKMDKLEKGIIALDYNPEFKCIFSASMQRDVHVWNPYVS